MRERERERDKTRELDTRKTDYFSEARFMFDLLTF